MTRFEIKALNPLISTAADRIKEALAKDDITERTDALLAARDDNAADVAKIKKRQLWKMIGLGALAVIGLGAAAGGAIAATSLVAAVAGTTGIAIPLMAVGVSLFGGAAAFLGLSVGDNNTLKAVAQGLSQKVESEVLNLIKSYPDATAKSSRLADFLLKHSFNPAAANDAAPLALSQPAPAVVNAAPRTNP